MEIDKLVISIQLQADQMQQQLESLQEKITKFGKQSKQNLDSSFDSKKVLENTKKIENVIANSTKNIVGILKGGLAGVGLGFGTQFALDFVRGVTKQGLSLKFASSAFGVNTDNLQLVQQLYKRIGSSPEAGTSALASIYQQLSNPQGARAFRSGLGALGNINPYQNGKIRDTGELLIEILKKSFKFSPAQRSSIFQSLGLGPELTAITNMTGNPQKLNQLIQNIKKEGFRSSEAVNQEAQMEQRFQSLAQRWQVISSIVADKLLPSLEGVTSSFERLFNLNKSDKNKLLSPKWWVNSLENYYHFDNSKVRKISLAIQNDWNHFKNKLAEMESSGGKNTTDQMFFGNDPRRGFGKYQITKAAYEQVMHSSFEAGKNNPALLEEAAKRYWALAMKLANNNLTGAYAFYNGGYKGLENWKRTGVGTSLAHQLRWQHILNNKNSSITHNHNVSMNLGNVNLPSVTNSNQFANEIQKMSTAAYAFSGNVLA